MSCARWIQADEDIAKSGIVLESPQGVKKNPAVTVAAEALRHLRSFTAEFGLTPASRTRIEVTADVAEDLLEAFLRNAPQHRQQNSVLTVSAVA
jgi:P27 family predicted phage terminase small subunit